MPANVVHKTIFHVNFRAADEERSPDAAQRGILGNQERVADRAKGDAVRSVDEDVDYINALFHVHADRLTEWFEDTAQVVNTDVVQDGGRVERNRGEHTDVLFRE